MDSIRQIRQGDGLSRLDLGLQFGHSGFPADEVRHLRKANTVAVMAGYHTVLLDGNDVADGHGGAVIICRVIGVESFPQLFQGAGPQPRCQFSRIDQIVIATFNS